MSERWKRLRYYCNQPLNADSYTYPMPEPNAFDYERLWETENLVSIPVDKIKGGVSTRIDHNLTWINNLDGNKLQRIDRIIDWIANYGVLHFETTLQYEHEEPSDRIEMNYFEDLDAYFIESGAHRSTVSKIIGMDTLKGRLAYYKLSPEKLQERREHEEKKKHERKIIKRKKNILDEHISNLGLSTLWEEESTGTNYVYCYYNQMFIWGFPISTIEDLEFSIKDVQELKEEIKAYRLLPGKLTWMNPWYKKIQNKNFSDHRDEIKQLSKSGYFK